jgi:hypothetical protein
VLGFTPTLGQSRVATPKVVWTTYHLHGKVEKMNGIGWFNIFVIIVKKMRVEGG